MVSPWSVGAAYAATVRAPAEIASELTGKTVEGHYKSVLWEKLTCPLQKMPENLKNSRHKCGTEESYP